MKEIELTQGLVALVDDKDYEACNAFNWNARYNSDGSVYAVRWASEHGGQYTRLHNFIMHPKEGEEVDHIDRDGLNCQRHNMRIGTRSQNMANRSTPGSASGYRGVYANRVGTWIVQIRHNGHLHSGGTYDTAEEAARAWDRLAKELHGEFAVLNFPEEG